MYFPWRDKKVLIVGLGVLGGGVGVAKFFAQKGAEVTVTDLKNRDELKPSLEKLKKYHISYVLGKHRQEDFKTCNLIVKNPAVPANSPYLAIAKKAGIPVEMEASLFFKLSPSKNIIGVTGTKGKTTTTLLIGQILKQAKLKTIIGGTPGYSIIEQIGKVTPGTWAVLELSSWQLESLKPVKISPHIGVLTNIFCDHLNRYKNFQDYVAVKKIIFQFQDNNDYFITPQNLEITKNLAKTSKSKVVFFSDSQLPKEVKGHIKLAGAHNLLNLAAAWEVAKILSISKEAVIAALDKFKPIPGHLEIVRKFGGVTFINDTTATIPEATIAAISSVTNRPIILLAGGADKGLDFRKFGEVVNQKVKTLVLLEGTATDKMEREIRKGKVGGRFSDFKKAIYEALKRSKKGDVVLLSPAAASFGMFKNEFDRGEKFRRIVRELEVRD